MTAEKRETNLQDTPIAISAFTQDSLDNKGITDVTNLTYQIPSLTVQSNGGIILINLRGAGNEINSSGADNGVGFHLDGVYIGNAAGSLAEMWDVERVEVLRGPQGTLFGRNTTGGSINTIANKPTDEFEVFGDFTYGNYDRTRFRGVVNAPLSDSVKVRLAGTREVRDGYIESLQPGVDDTMDKDSWFLRAQMDIDINENANLLLSVISSENDDASIGGGREGPNYQTPTGGFAAILGSPMIPPAALVPYDLPNAAPKPADPWKSNKNDERSNNTTNGITATFEWDLGSTVFKSISSYYEIDRLSILDFDDSETLFQAIRDTDESEQFSQEFQLLSNDTDGIEWILGAYFFTQDALRTTESPSIFDLVGGFGAGGDLETTSYAVFGQASISLTDTVKLTGGLRVSRDEKEATDMFFRRAPALPPPTGSNITDGGVDDSWTEPSGKLTLDWYLSGDNLAYVTLSRGYRSGAINITAPFDDPVDPEFVNALEFGSKNRFMNDRLQLNGALHYAEYDNQQFTRFLAAGNQVVEASGESTVYGLELDWMYAGAENLLIDGSFGWINAEFDKFETSFGPVFGPLFGLAPPQFSSETDLKGNNLPRTPELSVSLGIQYTQNFSFGDVALRLDQSHRSEIYYDTFNTDLGKEGTSNKTDFRVLFNSSDEKWNAELYVENIQDNAVTNNRIVNSDVPLVFYAPPRTYGLRVGYRL